MADHVVILAGGAGTRLWPASRTKRPKQLLDFGTGQSLFQATLKRALATEPDGGLLIVTHQDQAEEVAGQIRGVPAGKAPPGGIQILAEPRARNTAPAIALAAAAIKKADPAGSMLVLAADHVIHPLETFREDVRKARSLAASGYLVTFGIRPQRPETGFGYIEAGEPLAGGRRVRSFKEKPDLKTAELFFQSPLYFWNSGMFVFNVDTFAEELLACCPQVAGPFFRRPFPEGPGDPKKDGAAGAIRMIRDNDWLSQAYRETPSISVDYALMEKSGRCAMVEAGFTWSDVGSWDEVARIFASGAGEVFEVSSRGNYVLADQPVALAGVEDLLVVVRDGVVLVSRRGASQQVKDLVEKLRQLGRADLL